ncbi:MAG: glycosyltransferase [Chloroflexota bacterium]|nr:glycosyltransferase [Chloroflexota bacterium]
MRVAFISLFKRGLGGGESRVAHELAHHFAAHHDAALICPSDRTGLSEDNGLRIFGVRSAGDDEFYMPVLSGRAVRSIFDFLDTFDPDVVHAHEPALMGLIGQVWAKMHLVPFVHTSHVLPAKVLNFGATEALDLKLLQSSFSELVARQLLSDFYENCDAIIALNHSALKALRQFGYKGKTFMIPNGRDLQNYEWCENADVTSQEKTLTFVGYISRRKNQAYLIEVLRHLPEHYKLQLIGKPLSPDYEQQLKGLCEAHGLNNVVFTGRVPHEDIPSYLERTHVFVSASKMEVQSLVVIEALASGTPVVGLSNETIDELVDGDVGCWLPKDTDPEVFARRIERICTLPQPAYDKLCAKARDRVSHLDWSNIIALTLEAYNELLEDSTPITEEGAGLANLISFLPSGEVKDFLTDKVSVLESASESAIRPTKDLSLSARMRALRRVPGSTWLLTGLTIVLSLIGYLFMKGRRRGD